MESLKDILFSLAPLIIILGVLYFFLKFVLRKSHDGMDTSISMQTKAMEDQVEAIQLCRDTLELNKEMLSEMKAIKELLEKQ